MTHESAASHSALSSSAVRIYLKAPERPHKHTMPPAAPFEAPERSH